MANEDKASGARPVGTLNGANWNDSVRHYSVDSSNGTAIFPGDFVMLEADGNAAPATAAGGGTWIGVMVGKVADFDNLDQKHLAASTAGTILVTTDPNTIYEVQEDSTGSSLALTDRGNTLDVAAGAGDTDTGRSAHELDSSDIGTGANLKVVDLVDRPDNEVGTNAKWLVVINEHLYKAAVAGV